QPASRGGPARTLARTCSLMSKPKNDEGEGGGGDKEKPTRRGLFRRLLSGLLGLPAASAAAAAAAQDRPQPQPQPRPAGSPAFCCYSTYPGGHGQGAVVTYVYDAVGSSLTTYRGAVTTTSYDALVGGGGGSGHGRPPAPSDPA